MYVHLMCTLTMIGGYELGRFLMRLVVGGGKGGGGEGGGREGGDGAYLIHAKELPRHCFIADEVLKVPCEEKSRSQSKSGTIF